MNEIEHRLKSLKEITNIQCSNGNWNYDPYMHGLANGMLLAIATLENSEYVPLEAPKEWLKDKNTGLQPPEYISEQQGIKMRNNKALFEFLHDEVVYGSGGDGEGYVFVEDTDVKQMASDFMHYLQENKKYGFNFDERENGDCWIFREQESFCFTKQEYSPNFCPFADVVIKLY